MASYRKNSRLQKRKRKHLLREIMNALFYLIKTGCQWRMLPDSRSVKTSHHTNGVKGVDGGKKVKGRKQHIIVDTMGLIFCVLVHPANLHDSKAALHVIEKLRYKFSRMIKILANGGYRGELIEKVKSNFGWLLEVVLRSDKTIKFQILPKRWIVERTFAWFENYRRLSIDYEFNDDTTETMIQLAMIKLMLNRVY